MILFVDCHVALAVFPIINHHSALPIKCKQNCCTGFHTSTNTTPFKVVYGRDPPPLHPFIKGETIFQVLLNN